jgi:hypothetical protein
MMGAVQTTETSVNSYQSTRRYNPEDSRLHTHRRENLKSYSVSHFLKDILLNKDKGKIWQLATLITSSQMLSTGLL